MLPRAIAMVRFVQFAPGADMRRVEVERYDAFVHEGGYAAFGIVAVGLLVLLIPFRRREPWAWWALAVLSLVYVAPTFAVPILRSFPGFHVIWEGVLHSGVERAVLANLLLPATMLAALAVCFPSFLRKGTP
jgi:hypothetical protein